MYEPSSGSSSATGGNSVGALVAVGVRAGVGDCVSDSAGVLVSMAADGAGDDIRVTTKPMIPVKIKNEHISTSGRYLWVTPLSINEIPLQVGWLDAVPFSDCLLVSSQVVSCLHSVSYEQLSKN